MPGYHEGPRITATIRIGTAGGERQPKKGERPQGPRVSEARATPGRVARLDAAVNTAGGVLTNEERRKIIAAQKAGERYGRTSEFKTWREEVDATAAEVARKKAEAKEVYGGLLMATEADLPKEQGIDDKQVRKDMAQCVKDVLDLKAEVPLFDEQNLIGEKLEELLTEEDDKRRNALAAQFLGGNGLDPKAFLELLAPNKEDRDSIVLNINDYGKEIILIRNRMWALALRQMVTKGHHLFAAGKYSQNYGIAKNVFFFSPGAACADEDSGSDQVAISEIDIREFTAYLYARKERAVDIGGSGTGALAISVPFTENEKYPLDPKQLTPGQRAEMAGYWLEKHPPEPEAV